LQRGRLCARSLNKCRNRFDLVCEITPRQTLLLFVGSHFDNIALLRPFGGLTGHLADGLPLTVILRESGSD
jgi:hypothetical protein